MERQTPRGKSRSECIYSSICAGLLEETVDGGRRRQQGQWEVVQLIKSGKSEVYVVNIFQVFVVGRLYVVPFNIFRV